MRFRQGEFNGLSFIIGKKLGHKTLRRVLIDCSDSAEGLECLSHKAGVDELAELVFCLAGETGTGRESLAYEIRGPFKDEGFLAFEFDGLKVILLEGGFEPVPADVNGEVLLSDGVEQVRRLLVVSVGAGGTLICVVGKCFPGFSVVEGDEGSVPRFAADFV